MINLKHILLLGTLIFMSGCGISPEEARQRLADLDEEYTEPNFVEHAVAGDQMVVDLFLTAGMEPNVQAEVQMSIDDLYPTVFIESVGRNRMERQIGNEGIMIKRATPVLVASGSGNAEFVRKLLDLGADPNLTGEITMGSRTVKVIPLIQAVAHGNTESVRALLKAGADPSAKTDFLGTSQESILIAVGFGYSEIVQVLLEAGADPNVRKQDDKNTALLLAINGLPMNNTPVIPNERRLEMVEILLDAGADPTLENEREETAISLAFNNGQAEVMKVLMEEGVTFDLREAGFAKSRLHEAAENGHQEVVQFLIQKDANINAKSSTGATPLIFAAMNGHSETVDVLIEAGAKVNEEADHVEGNSALQAAAMKGHTDIVRNLLANGANPTFSTDYGKTALYQAARNGHLETVKILLNANNELSSLEGFELGIAAENGHEEIVRTLLDIGANPDSAIFQAAQGGNLDVLKTILERGVNPTPTDGEFNSLMTAIDHGHQDVVKLLLREGANPNFRDDSGSGLTALMYASVIGHTEMVRELLKAGADPSTEDNRGRSALDLANQQNNYQVARILKNAIDQAETALNHEKKGEAFLNENRKKPNVYETESGLQYQMLEEGSGESPSADDNVQVHYEGRLLSDEVFDSSYEKGRPVTYPLNRVLEGWTEGLQLMQEGAKYRFFIPSDLAYGVNPPPDSKIAPGAVLIFDVELIEVNPD